MRRHVLHIFIFVVGFILIMIWVFSLSATVTNIEPPKILNDEFDIDEIPSVENEANVLEAW